MVLKVVIGLILCASFTYAQTDDVLFPVRVGEQYGYINRRGQMVMKPQFDTAEKFHDGLALVAQGGSRVKVGPGKYWRIPTKRGYIDKTGKFIIPLGKYNLANTFSEGLAAVWMESPCDRSCYGYIDTTGTVVLEQKYQTAGEFTNGTADVRMSDDKWGVIDKSGKFIIPPEYDGVFPFREGVGIAITIKNKKSSPFDQVPEDFATDLYDMNGDVIARPPYFVFGAYESGLVEILTRSGQGFIDIRGNLVIAPSFQGAHGFSEGLCAVKVNNKWGYINPSGKFAIEPSFDKAYAFSDGLAVVEVNGKEGYIDKNGRFAIQPRDWSVSGFEDGLALVRRQGWSGYIDKTGKFVWKTKD